MNVLDRIRREYAQPTNASARVLTDEEVFARVVKSGAKGLRPSGGEARGIFNLAQAGKVKMVHHYGPTGNAYYKYVAA